MKIFKKQVKSKDIETGYKIDSPDSFVPWGISPSQFEALFKDYPIKKVTRNYYTLECTSLDGLNHMLGFHFQTSEGKFEYKLNLLEFFRLSYPDYEKSFEEFQRYFANRFGKASKEHAGNAEGFLGYEWRIGDIQIHHYIMERFGLEEKLLIMKGSR